MNPPSTPTDAPADEAPDAIALDQAEVDLVGSVAAGPAALRGSVLLGGGYAATIGLSLISAPLLIRHLGISEFGRYTTVLALVTVVNGLTDAGLMNIALREWASRTGEDRARFMRSLMGIRLELSAAGVVVGVLFALVAGYDSTLVIGTLVAGVGMVFTAVANLLTASLQGELRFGWVTVINLVRQVVAVALLVALVLAGAGLLPLLASTSVAGIAALALAAVLVRGRMPLRPRLRDTQWWPLVRDTLPYAAAIAVNTFYFRVTIVVMSLIAAAEQTGYFATSFRVIEVLIGVPALAIGAAFPILSRSAHSDRDRFAYATARIVDLSVIAGVGLALGVALSAPWVVRLLAGPSGAPAAPVLQIQAIALAATFLTMACGFIFLSLRRHTILLIANGGALLVNVVLTIVLVNADQAQGGAVAAAVAETSLSIGLLIALLRANVTRIGVPALLVVVVAGLAGAAPLLVSRRAPARPHLRRDRHLRGRAGGVQADPARDPSPLPARPVPSRRLRADRRGRGRRGRGAAQDQRVRGALASPTLDRRDGARHAPSRSPASHRGHSGRGRTRQRSRASRRRSSAACPRRAWSPARPRGRAQRRRARTRPEGRGRGGAGRRGESSAVRRRGTGRPRGWGPPARSRLPAPAPRPPPSAPRAGWGGAR